MLRKSDHEIAMQWVKRSFSRFANRAAVATGSPAAFCLRRIVDRGLGRNRAAFPVLRYLATSLSTQARPS